MIVSADPLARSRLAALLSDQPGCTIVGQTGDTDLRSASDLYGPDVIIWDLSPEAAPLDQPIAAVSDLDVPVIVLCADESTAAGALAGGARGCLLQDVGAEHLMAALIAVSDGLIVIDPSFRPSVSHGREPALDQPVEELTPREFEVLQLLAEGLSNKAIAQRLGLSENTVKFHIGSIYGKLGAHNRTEAVTQAARLGLIVL